MPLTLFSRKTQENTAGSKQAKARSLRDHKPPDHQPADKIDLLEDPLEQNIQLERYGLIVRQKSNWQDHPQIETIFREVMKIIDERFALVPEGFATLPQTLSEEPGYPEVDVETAPFLLARHCVTNEQYQMFVDSGGYSDLSLWPKDVWPHLIDFKDQTWETGPRFWRNSRHDKRLADHPVVGISFHEAAAYACWAGYRLPTEAEWQMAASWCIRSSSNVLRRYPWGDALDKRRCNIWLSGIGRPVAVDNYPSGAAPNGILQLIGNVWEWTDSDFQVTDNDGRPIVGNMLMKSIRGGAFDTYFHSQATSCFRTGLAGLMRTHNVGIRCVLDGNSNTAERSDS